MQTPVRIFSLVVLLVFSACYAVSAHAQNRTVLTLPRAEANKLTEYEKQLRLDLEIPPDAKKIRFYFAGPPADAKVDRTLILNTSGMSSVTAVDYGDRSHPDINKNWIVNFGVERVLKESEFLAKAAREACKKAYLNAIYELREKAVRVGGDAVIGILSGALEGKGFAAEYKFYASHDLFLCTVKEGIVHFDKKFDLTRSGLIADVALRGDTVRFKK